MSKTSKFDKPPSKKDFTEDGEGSIKKRETKRRHVTEKASDRKVRPVHVIVIDAILNVLYTRYELEERYKKDSKDIKIKDDRFAIYFGGNGVRDLKNKGMRFPTKLRDAVGKTLGRKNLEFPTLYKAVTMIDIEEHPEDGYIKIEKRKDENEYKEDSKTERIRLTKMGLMYMQQRIQGKNIESPSSLFWEIVERSGAS